MMEYVTLVNKHMSNQMFGLVMVWSVLVSRSVARSGGLGIIGVRQSVAWETSF